MLKIKKQEKIFIVSGPSGSGKTTILEHLFKNKKIKNQLLKVVTATTRNPRKGEKNGRDYWFYSLLDFEKKEKNKFFIETKEFSGNKYGTPKFYISQAKKENKDVLFCIDVEGALKIKKEYENKTVLIFILPPSEEELKKRLLKRGSETEDSFAKRLFIARKEITFAKKYDYVILNENSSIAAKEMETILSAERLRIEKNNLQRIKS